MKADTPDMGETNNKLGNIETAISELKDYVKSSKEMIQNIADYINGSNGYYSLNSLIYDQATITNNNIQQQTEVLTSVQEQTVSSNQLLQDIQIKTDDTAHLLADTKNAITGDNGVTSTLTLMSDTLTQCSADLSVLSQQAQADINNEQLLEGLNESIETLNKNIDRINTFLGYLYAFAIFLVVAIISVVIFRLLWNTLIKNVFAGF